MISREAVSLYRELYHETPEAYGSFLALALNNITSTLGEHGQSHEGLEAAEEAIAIYQTFEPAYHDAIAPDLAAALHTQARSPRRARPL